MTPCGDNVLRSNPICRMDKTKWLLGRVHTQQTLWGRFYLGTWRITYTYNYTAYASLCCLKSLQHPNGSSYVILITEWIFQFSFLYSFVARGILNLALLKSWVMIYFDYHIAPRGYEITDFTNSLFFGGCSWWWWRLSSLDGTLRVSRKVLFKSELAIHNWSTV